jgi:hypothetical protein
MYTLFFPNTLHQTGMGCRRFKYFHFDINISVVNMVMLHYVLLTKENLIKKANHKGPTSRHKKEQLSP